MSASHCSLAFHFRILPTSAGELGHRHWLIQEAAQMYPSVILRDVGLNDASTYEPILQVPPHPASTWPTVTDQIATGSNLGAYLSSATWMRVLQGATAPLHFRWLQSLWQAFHNLVSRESNLFLHLSLSLIPVSSGSDLGGVFSVTSCCNHYIGPLHTVRVWGASAPDSDMNWRNLGELPRERQEPAPAGAFLWFVLSFPNLGTK